MFITKATIRALREELTRLSDNSEAREALEMMFNDILYHHDKCADSAPIAAPDIIALFNLYDVLSMQTDENCIAGTQLLAEPLLGYSEPYRINKNPESSKDNSGAVQKFSQTKQVEWNQKSQHAVSLAANLLPRTNLESIYDLLRTQRGLIHTHGALQHYVSAIRSDDNPDSQIQEGIDLNHEPVIISQTMIEIFRNQLMKKYGRCAKYVCRDNEGNIVITQLHSGQNEDTPGFRFISLNKGEKADQFVLNPPPAFSLKQENNTYKATLAKFDERYITPLKNMPVRTKEELHLFFIQLGGFVYDMVEACFLIRGSAAVNKWLYRAIIQSKLGAPFELAEGLPYDLEAFAYINQQDFAEAFAKRYDYLAPLVKAEKTHTHDVAATSENRYSYLSPRREYAPLLEPKPESLGAFPA